MFMLLKKQQKIKNGSKIFENYPKMF